MLVVTAFLFCAPLLPASEEVDPLNVLVEEMRRLTFAGDHASVGHLVPAVLEELTKAHPRAGIAWNRVGVYFQTQGDSPRQSEHTNAASGGARRKAARLEGRNCCS